MIQQNITMTTLTIQEILIKNIESGDNKGITFIEGNGNTDFLSYKQLYLQALYVLNALQEKGIKPGNELMFQFKSNKSFLITFWACILGKIIPVPITFGVNKGIFNKVINVWNTLNNPYLISDFPTWPKKISPYFEAEEQTLGEIHNNFILYQDLNFTKKGTIVPTTLNDLAYLQFSSGSTGDSKGVMIKQENLLANIQNLSTYLKVTEEDRFLSWLPVTHDMGLVLFHLLPLVKNVAQCLMPPFTFLTYPELWLKSFSEYKTTVSGSPNFGYKYVLDSLEEMELGKLDLSSLRLLINGAEPVSVDLCNRFCEAFKPYGLQDNIMRPAYGLAEAVLGVSFWIHDEQPLKSYYLDRDKLAIGNKVEFLDPSDKGAAPFADLGPSWMEIKITDEQNRELPKDTLGIVHLRSKDVTSGYYNKPAITRAVLSEDGWFNTGDLGLIHEEHLVLTGRIKEMILVSGQNYFPNDLDEILEELPFVKSKQIATCGIFNEDAQKDEIYVFLNYHGDLSEFIGIETEIRKHMTSRTRLGIKKVIPVKEIPLTTSGKIQRHILTDNLLNRKYDHLIADFEPLTSTLS